VHHLTRAITLNTEQFGIRPMRIGIVHGANPESSSDVGCRIVKPDAFPSGQWIAEWLKLFALRIPSRNSFAGSRDKSRSLSNPEGHDWRSRFEYFQGSRSRGEPQDLVLLDEVDPIERLFLCMPDRSLPDYIA